MEITKLMDIQYLTELSYLTRQTREQRVGRGLLYGNTRGRNHERNDVTLGHEPHGDGSV